VTQTFGVAAPAQFHDEESPLKQIDNQLMMMMMIMMMIMMMMMMVMMMAMTANHDKS